jgi:NADH-quinone oxidoreductase subunit E
MTFDDLIKGLRKQISGTHHPRELAIDVMFALQNRDGYLTDRGLREAADLLGMTLLELEETATFYDFIYREPVGKFVIHVCDGLTCWMFGGEAVTDYLCRKLDITVGETTRDGLFTVLPTACIGYCDRAPALLINRVPYGPLTPEKIDTILADLKSAAFRTNGERT